MSGRKAGRRRHLIVVTLCSLTLAITSLYGDTFSKLYTLKNVNFSNILHSSFLKWTVRERWGSLISKWAWR
ncbi:hypothetical protein F4803DRAFT_512383 [Xylaria telfairii]|nr:hypothetical protein F4803DRAFT_512383 [Xylaria telfairii]